MMEKTLDASAGDSKKAPPPLVRVPWGAEPETLERPGVAETLATV